MRAHTGIGERNGFAALKRDGIASIAGIWLVIFVCTVSVGNGATWWVATNGVDTDPGTSNQPFASPQKAISVMAAGDGIYVGGGTYLCATEVKAGKSGFATNFCKLWAYPGERPVFDFTNAAAGLRGIYMGKDYWHVRGFEVANSKDNGILISGGFNLIEGCVVHDSNDDGIYITSNSGVLGHDNTIVNCDSYRNYQAAAHGDNGDGFAAKTGCGAGNVFRGCRAWNNSDDGWDFYDNKTNSVTVDNCWSFANGLNLWADNAFAGNGNGFKLGGASTYAKHLVKNCVAFDNVHDGFDQNHTKGGQTIYNCTGLRNAVNFQFPELPTNGVDVLKNNLAYSGSIAMNATAQQTSNSWQGFNVTTSDFVSVDGALALAPRNPDYSLPTNAFVRLASGSGVIDKGVNVGLPYSGAAPDLGAYEYVPSSTNNIRTIFFDHSPGSLRFTNGAFAMRIMGLTGHGPIVLSG
ncbi:MAG TPA: right-handed parallel beta-helix repeat-containing protein, partial [Candidatus Dormibacteraeota bacterium]|nr:right-handed parallel beta-helix repeat-containing protein [Candidatus Dormibacteraeota bacterium]